MRVTRVASMAVAAVVVACVADETRQRSVPVETLIYNYH